MASSTILEVCNFIYIPTPTGEASAGASLWSPCGCLTAWESLCGCLTAWGSLCGCLTARWSLCGCLTRDFPVGASLGNPLWVPHWKPLWVPHWGSLCGCLTGETFVFAVGGGNLSEWCGRGSPSGCCLGGSAPLGRYRPQRYVLWVGEPLWMLWAREAPVGAVGGRSLCGCCGLRKPLLVLLSAEASVGTVGGEDSVGSWWANL